MKKELELTLVKTCIGLVKEETFNGVLERAKAITFETGLTLKEAVEILLKLASESIDGWNDIGCGVLYFEFDTTFDYFSLYEWHDETEIVCLYNDNFNILYSLNKKKFYKEFAANEYGDELIKEEIEI